MMTSSARFFLVAFITMLGAVALLPEAAAASKIPRRIFQFGMRRTVSRSMRTSMRTLREFCDGCEIRYVSEDDARAALGATLGPSAGRIISTVASAATRHIMYALMIIHREGGVFIPPYVSAAGSVSDAIDFDAETLLYTVMPGGALTADIFGAAANHPAMLRGFNTLLTAVVGRNADIVIDPAASLNAAFTKSAGHRIEIVPAGTIPKIDVNTVGPLVLGYRGLESDLKTHQGGCADWLVRAKRTPVFFRDIAVSAAVQACPLDATDSSATVADIPLALVEPPESRPKAQGSAQTVIPTTLVVASAGNTSLVTMFEQQAALLLDEMNGKTNILRFPAAAQREYLAANGPANAQRLTTDSEHTPLLRHVFQLTYLYREGGCAVDEAFATVSSIETLFTAGGKLMLVVDASTSRSRVHPGFICAVKEHPFVRTLLTVLLQMKPGRETSRAAIDAAYLDAYDTRYGTAVHEAVRNAGDGVQLLTHRKPQGCGSGHILDDRGTVFFATPFAALQRAIDAARTAQ